MRLMDPRDKRWFLSILILLCVLLCLSLLSGGATLPEKAVALSLRPVQSGSATTAAKINEFLSGIFDSPLKKQVEELKKENEELYKRLAEYDELKAQNSQYREMLDIKTEDKSTEIIDTMVVSSSREAQGGVYMIDKGEKDGVFEGAAVISGKGLAGKVVKVYPTTALIVSVLSTEMRIGAYESGSKEDGVAAGDSVLWQKGLIKLDYLQPDTRIEEGNVIVTSGVSGTFPKGIPIGEVDYVDREPTGLACYAAVRPFVDIRTERYLFVVTAFEKAGE